MFVMCKRKSLSLVLGGTAYMASSAIRIGWIVTRCFCSLIYLYNFVECIGVTEGLNETAKDKTKGSREELTLRVQSR